MKKKPDLINNTMLMYILLVVMYMCLYTNTGRYLYMLLVRTFLPKTKKSCSGNETEQLLGNSMCLLPFGHDTKIFLQEGSCTKQAARYQQQQHTSRDCHIPRRRVGDEWNSVCSTCSWAQEYLN